MTDERIVPGAVRDGPPTATAVYLALDDAGPLTYNRLTTDLGFSRSAVEMTIAYLREHDLVIERIDDPTAPCQKRWELAK
mgnify:CR=1 FL=1